MTRILPLLLLLTGCAGPSHVERPERPSSEDYAHIERVTRQLSEGNGSWTYQSSNSLGLVTISRTSPLFGMSGAAGDARISAPTNMPVSVNWNVAVPPIQGVQQGQQPTTPKTP